MLTCLHCAATHPHPPARLLFAPRCLEIDPHTRPSAVELKTTFQDMLAKRGITLPNFVEEPGVQDVHATGRQGENAAAQSPKKVGQPDALAGFGGSAVMLSMGSTA